MYHGYTVVVNLACKRHALIVYTLKFHAARLTDVEWETWQRPKLPSSRDEKAVLVPAPFPAGPLLFLHNELAIESPVRGLYSTNEGSALSFPERINLRPFLFSSLTLCPANEKRSPTVSRHLNLFPVHGQCTSRLSDRRDHLAATNGIANMI